MWRLSPMRRTESSFTRARLFMACWNVTASVENELVFQLRSRVLTLDALKDVVERALSCPPGDATRFVFDLSGVDEMESCYSLICALFIHFATQVGNRCRITGLRPRLREVIAFFLQQPTGIAA